MRCDPLRLVTLGVGALASPRFAPAGLLVERACIREMIDGGPGAAPRGKLAAWKLVVFALAKFVGTQRHSNVR